MKRRYVTLDVFTETKFGGNPLAVVLDAEGLDGDAMQAITREFNYSETTFVLPPADPSHTAHVRIFTPSGELPFAGHPNVGTAFALARIGTLFGRDVAGTLVFEEQAGLVPMRILSKGGDITGAQLTAPQRLRRGKTMAPAAIAACLGLPESDVVAHKHPPQAAGVGTDFMFAQLRAPETLARVRPNTDAFAQHFPSGGGPRSLFAYARSGANAVFSRMFFPVPDIREDPATGSAAAALAALLADISPRADGTQRLNIAQGVEMGRPSMMRSEVDKSAGTITAVRIGGSCVAVMEGLIDA